MNFDILKEIFEYFNLKSFLEMNPPFKLLFLGIIIFILLTFAHFVCEFIEKKLSKWALKNAPASSAGDQSSKVHTKMDLNIFKKLIKNGRGLLYLIIFGWGLKEINFGLFYQELMSVIFITLATILTIRFLIIFIPFDMDIYLRRKGESLENSQARSLVPIIKGLIWALGLTFLLDNLGCHVSTIIAGLGIMGVAVGLAGQAILADFFSYIVILFDKPFRIGDFVILSNGKSGDVIYMGPKTTRLLSLKGDIIICANSEMTKGILVNQGSSREREVVLEIGVSYSNPMPVVRKVPEILKEVVNSISGCSFNHACMLNFGSANFLFQLIYHVQSSPDEITNFLEVQSEVNLAIQEKLNEEKISGSYPTQEIIISNLPVIKTKTVASVS